MRFSDDLTRFLDALTEALDGSGDDLNTAVRVLADDLLAAISSFVGLTVTLDLDDELVTVMAMNSHTAATSMLLPLASATGVPAGSHLVLYAENPGAFVDLAADTQAAYGHRTRVVLDGHLPPPTAAVVERSIQALGERALINQAIGFRIEQGFPPARARAEIGRRAAATGLTPTRIAQMIMNPLGYDAARPAPRGE